MDPEHLKTRYLRQIDEICTAVEQGNPPWLGPVARLGPPILARTGRVLRGLPAVIAWHVANSEEKPWLAWQLVGQDHPESEEKSAIFLLAANGGEALYRAVPHRRSSRMVDAPPRLSSAVTCGPALAARLTGIVAQLGKAAPNLENDLDAVVSLARAFLRPLGAKDWDDEPVSVTTKWTLHRLARVVAWARLLADDVKLTVPWSDLDRDRPRLVIKGSEDWSRQNSWPDRLVHSAWMKGCVPTELYQKAPAPQLVPEQPINTNLIRFRHRRRTPGLAVLLHDVGVSNNDDADHVEAVTATTGRWLPMAALGLALVERLDSRPLPDEPGLAWRRVGRALRRRMQRGKRAPRGVGALPNAQTGPGVLGLWLAMVRDHRRTAWIHAPGRSTVGDLLKTGRWERDTLAELVMSVRGERTASDEVEQLPLDRLPLVRLALAQKNRRSRSVQERDMVSDLAEALGCAPSWQAVVDAADRARWHRYPRSKPSGGVRWLDVPSSRLAAAQKHLSDLLLAVSPPGWAATAFLPGCRPALHAAAHVGAVAAVRMDIRDFFGSVRPRHLEPWLGVRDPGSSFDRLPGWSAEGRAALLCLLFRRRGDRFPYLPQGAPSSPAAANLAGLWLDYRIATAADDAFRRAFCYTRYADDLVLSTKKKNKIKGFSDAASLIITEAVRDQGWSVQPHKTRAWTTSDRTPLVLCGLVVPRTRKGRLTVDRPTRRRAEAALHRLRHRLDDYNPAEDSANRAHGLLSYIYSATGDLRWLAYTSNRLSYFARTLAGPLFAESLLAGWSDRDPPPTHG